MSDTPRTDAAWHEFNESASAISFRDFARELERELEAVQHTRRNAEKVCADAIADRNLSRQREAVLRNEVIRLQALIDQYAEQSLEDGHE